MTTPPAARLPFVLTGYSLPLTMGYIARRTGEVNRSPWSTLDLLQAADRCGLVGIEVPLATRVPSFDGATVELPSCNEELAVQLQARQLRLIADFGVILEHSPDEIVAYLELAHRTGARVVRAILSNVLCGDRRTVAEGWQTRLERTAARLRDVLPEVARLKMCLAIENHQDACSDDLLRLYDLVHQHSAFGVTLDTGNPLSTCEDPVVYCERIAPIIRHLHLKDYTVHWAPTGYRLVRCAVGQGVVDLDAILSIVGSNGHEILPGIEMAAQAGRLIRWHDPTWWSTYDSRDATQLLPLAQRLWTHVRGKDDPGETLWERDGAIDDVCAEEWRLVEQSISFLAQRFRVF